MSRIGMSGIGAGAAAGALFIHERRAKAQAERLSAATLETLLNAIDANDAETGAHVRRVAAYAQILGDAAGFDEHTLRSIERVALFHDIGKLHEALTDIFHDPAKLTPEERRAVRTHPDRGEEGLEPLVAFYPDLGKGVRAHHERWNGTGYPRRLKGKKIPLAARVVAIADSFDAITHRRRYSPAKSMAEAVAAIAEGRGTQFDPELADLFLSPPVMAKVERTMRDAHSPKRKKKGNRRGRANHPAPDIKFRWRIETKRRRAPGR
jgi:HD-GYP domain-containing protein (c-di-GMP phosphodiesterase class II)